MGGMLAVLGRASDGPISGNEAEAVGGCRRRSRSMMLPHSQLASAGKSVGWSLYSLLLPSMRNEKAQL